MMADVMRMRLKILRDEGYLMEPVPATRCLT